MLCPDQVAALSEPFIEANVVRASKEKFLMKAPGPDGFHTVFLSEILECGRPGYSTNGAQGS